MSLKPIQYLRFSIVVISVIIWLNAQSILISYGKWLSPSTFHPSGEIAVVLAGNPHRLKVGVQLLARGQVQAIYSASPSPDLTPTRKRREAKILARLLKKNSIPKQKSYWGIKTVKNTFDEALTFQQTIDQLGLHPHQIVIVSDPYHLQRALWTFRLVLGKEVIVQTQGTFNPDPNWWRERESRQQVFWETLKLPWYWLYYGLLQSKTPLSPRDLWGT